MIEISLVSYSNTLPFKFGLENSAFIKQNAKLIFDNPANCAKNIIEKKTAMGLVPIAALPQLKDFEIISSYCLAAFDEVESVLILSNNPLSKINRICMDYQSMTSVNMIKILNKKFWNRNIDFVQAKPGFEENIEDGSAALIIGDRALRMAKNYKYRTDLASEWKKHTGLPAIFAVWVANSKIPQSFVEEFNQALKSGVDERAKIADYYQNDYPEFNLKHYLTNCMDYHLDKQKLDSLNLFLKLSESL